MSLKGTIRGEDFKVHVVKEVLAGFITIEGARIKYKIASRSVIRSWIRKYEIYGSCSILSQAETPATDMKSKSKSKEPESPDEATGLAKKVQLLERQLQEQQLLSEMYSRMIDIAEKQYKIAIRKNSGTK